MIIYFKKHLRNKKTYSESVFQKKKVASRCFRIRLIHRNASKNIFRIDRTGIQKKYNEKQLRNKKCRKQQLTEWSLK